MLQLNRWQTSSSDFYLLLFGQQIETRRAKAVLASVAYAGDFVHIAIASHSVEKVQRASQAVSLQSTSTLNDYHINFFGTGQVENLMFYQPENSFSGNVTSVKILTSWQKWKRNQLRIEEERQENKTRLEDTFARPLSKEIFQDRFADMRGKVLRVTYLEVS